MDVLAILQPLAAHLSPRSLARLACAFRDCAHACTDDLWAATAVHAGLSSDATSRDAIVAYYQRQCVFCCDSTFGATVSGRRVTLELGATEPATRRVSAAHSVRGFRSSVDFSILELSHDANHHVILWLGVLFDRQSGAALDANTLDGALEPYDVPIQGAKAGSRLGKGMRERFSTGRWSMNAFGSSGAVWSGGSVNRLLPCRFGAGDKVRLMYDETLRELRVCVTSGVTGESSEHVALRRLLRPRSGEARGTPLHVIVHLTDVAIPAFGRRARAVLEVDATEHA